MARRKNGKYITSVAQSRPRENFLFPSTNLIQCRIVKLINTKNILGTLSIPNYGSSGVQEHSTARYTRKKGTYKTFSLGQTTVEKSLIFLF
jgi:hypothetical protein